MFNQCLNPLYLSTVDSADRSPVSHSAGQCLSQATRLLQDDVEDASINVKLYGRGQRMNTESVMRDDVAVHDVCMYKTAFIRERSRASERDTDR